MAQSDVPLVCSTRNDSLGVDKTDLVAANVNEPCGHEARSAWAVLYLRLFMSIHAPLDLTSSEVECAIRAGTIIRHFDALAQCRNI